MKITAVADMCAICRKWGTVCIEDDSVVMVKHMVVRAVSRYYSLPYKNKN